MKKVYLDNAATTKIDESVLEQMTSVMREVYGNPSSTHSFGKAGKTLIEKSRKEIAGLLGADVQEIIFTSGGTEANNMILRSAVRDCGVTCIITSAIEHHAVLNTILQLQKEYELKVVYVDTDSKGNVLLDSLEALLQEYANEKILVSLMHVNNETGNILPIEKVGGLCKNYGALFHSDTVQSVSHVPINAKQLGIDFFTASGHKFHGPKGIGFAYIRRDSGIKPLLFGGEQERGLRAGTESVHNIVGLATALVLALKNRAEVDADMLKIKQYFSEGLRQAFPEVAFNGESGNLETSVPNILNVRFPFPEAKGKLLLFQLDLIGGIACSAGSACQSGSNKDSHVLTHILSDVAIKKPSVRFSFSKYTTVEEIDYTLEVLKKFANS